MKEKTISTTIEPIGFIKTCFKEKFGAPRQSGLVPSAEGIIELSGKYNVIESCAHLEEFSHIWILFQFHLADKNDWSPSVRPPRLGGNKKVGVFASRSPFRPNSIGMSVVKLDKIEHANGQVKIYVKGVDIVDGTPVIDIKPYLPETESIPTATCGWAENLDQSKKFNVIFSEKVQSFCHKKEIHGIENLTQLISEFLQLDPRPAYSDNLKPDEDRKKYFGAKIYDFDVHWEVEGDNIYVTDVFTKPTDTDEA